MRSELPKVLQLLAGKPLLEHVLGMSRSQSELRLVEGQPVERLMLPVSLSYDHRVINGADAARFLAALCNMLSDPFQLLSAI